MCIPAGDHDRYAEIGSIFYDNNNILTEEQDTETEDWSFDDHLHFTPTVAEVQAVAHHFDHI